MVKESVTMAYEAGLKRLRRTVRGEMAIHADYVLNEVEDAFKKEFNRRVLAGEPYLLLPAKWDQWARDTVYSHIPALADKFNA